jgi:PAS domain S-box-containing protein
MFQALENKESTPLNFVFPQSPDQLLGGQYAGLVEEFPVAVCACDVNGSVKLFNRAARALWGHTPQNENDLWSYVGSRANGNTSSALKKRLLASVPDAQTFQSEGTVVIKRSDGTSRRARVVSQVLAEEGKPVGIIHVIVKVSDEKDLAMELFETPYGYDTVVNNLPAAIYACDKEGNIVFYNQQASKLWGYAPQIKEHSLKFCAFYKVYTLDGTHVPADQTPMAACVYRGERFKNFEAIFERADGSRFYALVNIDPIYDEEHNLNGAVNVFQDITDRKLAELTLLESQKKYEQLIQSLPSAVYTTDAEGRVLLFNRAAVELWGRIPEPGKDVWCGSWKIFRTSGDLLPLELCPMAITLKTGESITKADIIIERPDGVRRRVSANPRPLFDLKGKLTGAVNMLVDITEQKDRELQVAASEERLRIAIQTAEMGCWDYNPATNVIICDRRARELFGFKPGDEITPEKVLEALSEDDKERAQKTMEAAMKSGSDGNYDLEYRIVRSPDKEPVTVRAKGKVIFDENERPLRFLGTVLDITEQKRAKDVLKHLVEERTHELMLVNEQLAKSNQELEQFAYITSHDLQEPLRKILTFSSLIQQNITDVSASKRYLPKIDDSALRMSNLIKDLLHYSRLSINSEKTVVDLNEVISQVLNDFDLLIEEKKASIHVEPMPVIPGIHHQIHQLFSNLISNALKFTKGNKPVIRISSKVIGKSQLKEKLSIDSVGPYLQILIADNGIGFDQKYADKIFTLFQRLNPRDSYVGTGIGLAICKKIVDNHGGSISATGIVHRGARFKVIFPLE